MAEPWLSLAAGCALLSISTQLEPSQGGLVEQSELLVESVERCQQLSLALPAGVAVLKASGVQKNSDGTRIVIRDIQWEQSDRGLDDQATLLLHLPAMKTGDRALVKLERSWPEGTAWSWTPGLPRAEEARLVLRGGLESTDGERLVKLQNPEEDFRVTVQRPPTEAAPRSTDFSRYRSPSESVTLEQQLKIVVPSGDPLILLWPGAGSQVEVTERLDFAPEPIERAYIVPLRAGVENIDWSADPKGSATLVHRTDDAVVLLPASEGPARVLLHYTAPNAPTYGAVPSRPNTTVTQLIRVPNGRIQWEPNKRYWRLASIDGRAILPNRDILVRALAGRFRAASIPEPGLPMSLRGRQTDWELAAELRPTLMERVTQATWPSDPMWPRALMKARKSEAVSQTEATLILQRYAEQAGFRAEWYFTRADSDGSELATSPAGFENSILRIIWEEEERWIDPYCGACGDFEIRPELYGRALLGPTKTVSPALPTGSWAITIEKNTIQWELTGPYALNFRRLLEAHPEQLASDRLVEGGSDDLETEGLSTPEAPVRVKASASKPLTPEDTRGWTGLDPLSQVSDGVWLGQKRLQVLAESCESFEHSGAGWTASVGPKMTVWTVDQPLDSTAQAALQAHITTYWPDAETCL